MGTTPGAGTDPGLTRALRLFGLLLGVGILTWLIGHADTAALWRVSARIGWGFLAIVAARASSIVVDSAAWYLLVPHRERPAFVRMTPLRWIGEAINTTLPAGQIGGEVVRAQLLQRLLAAPAHGAASVAVDFALSLFAQILFTLLGFVLLARLGSAVDWWWVVGLAALVPAFAVLCWELLARRRLLAAAERWAARLGQRRLAAVLHALAGGLGLIAEGRVALALSLCLHGTSFVVHAGDLWLTLYLMGAPTGIEQATMLESLSLAARSAAFLIPSGWGAQEASLVALAAVTGISLDTALALGLVKRAREFAIGLPGLATWGWLERRNRRR